MAKSPDTFTLVWIDDKGSKPVIDHEEFTDQKALDLRVATMASLGAHYGVLLGRFCETVVDTSPRVTITKPTHKLAAPAKPRKPRRSRAQIEADEKAKGEARAAASKAKGNGASVAS